MISCSYSSEAGKLVNVQNLLPEVEFILENLDSAQAKVIRFPFAIFRRAELSHIISLFDHLESGQ